MTRAWHRRRVPTARLGQRGLTLIELLLGLALLALLAAFIAGGLVFARRSVLLDRTADLSAEADAAMQTLADLLAAAAPVMTGQEGGPRTIVFDGHGDRVSFVGFGTGHAMRGGLHVITISLDEGKLVAEVTPTPDGKRIKGEGLGRRVVLLNRVRGVEFGFFGSFDRRSTPGWRDDWSKAEDLPLQISCRLLFTDDRRPSPIFIATLRQRA